MEESKLKDALCELLRTPMKIEEIRRAFPNIGKKEIHDILNHLSSEGKIMKNKKNRFALSSHYGCQTGIFLATERGFSFVTPDENPNGKDFFIPANSRGGAWHGDHVLVKVKERKNNHGKSEALVLRVLSRAEGKLTGTLIQRGKQYFVAPSSKKYPEISVHPKDLLNAEAGDKVAIFISFYGDEKIKPQGKITANFGKEGTLESSIAAILHENGVFDFFPEEVLAAADAIPQEVIISSDENRLDLRDKLIFTIDGDDAKDFDDAVSIEKLDNGHFLVGVHIADVSHYVKPGSALDIEAFRRATSVYYPGHVIPMLPFALSHGVCSLNPEVDRFTFSAFMELDKDGRKHKATFSKSIICSKARMTYRNVNKILDGEKELCEQYDFLYNTIIEMNTMAKTLHKRRLERGALELDIPEAQIILNEEGIPVDLTYRERGQSERLIEEFMLLANEAVAEHMSKKDLPTVYRVHENPDPDKLRVFATFAKPFGYRINPNKPEDTVQFQAVLDGAKNDPKQRILPTLLLRSLARARYADECIGHYGLKAKFYLHFTSPIRRYPDLVAHRMLQKQLLGETFEKTDYRMCEEAASQSTTREQAADICERDIDKLFIAAYMKQFIGEEFDAEVSGVQSFGVFVALENGCEGLIRMELLSDDYYEYDDERMMLYGKHSGNRITIGTKMHVILLSASEINGQIDFAPADGKPLKQLLAKNNVTNQHSNNKTRKTSSSNRPQKKNSRNKKNTRKRRFC